MGQRNKSQIMRYHRIPFMPSRLIGFATTINRFPVQGDFSEKVTSAPSHPVTPPALRTVYPGMPWLPVGN